MLLCKYVPADEVACIVIETIQGDGGLLDRVPGYFEAFKRFVVNMVLKSLSMIFNKVLGEQVHGVQSRILILRLI